MKKESHFWLFKIQYFFILTIFLSCNDDYVGYDVQMENWTRSGKLSWITYYPVPMENGNGKNWTRLGDIPPNEVALVYHGSRGWQYVCHY